MRLSYVITSLSPSDINDRFRNIKTYFNSIYNDDQTADTTHSIRKNHAHITLKRAFYLREGIRDEEVRRALMAIKFKPFPITATKLEVFKTHKYGNVFVASVDPIPELKKLHEDLVSLIATGEEAEEDVFEGEHFTPHLSILYRLPEEKIPEAMDYAEKQILPITFTLDAFQLMRQIPGVVGERELLQTYPASK